MVIFRVISLLRFPLLFPTSGVVSRVRKVASLSPLFIPFFQQKSSFIAHSFLVNRDNHPISPSTPFFRPVHSDELLTPTLFCDLRAPWFTPAMEPSTGLVRKPSSPHLLLGSWSDNSRTMSPSPLVLVSPPECGQPFLCLILHLVRCFFFLWYCQTFLV